MKGILQETMTKASWREAFNKYSLKDAESLPKTNKYLINTDDKTKELNSQAIVP